MAEAVTYARLRYALTSLGFVEHPVAGGIVFWEEKSATRLTLPDMPQDAPVLARHLGTARLTVTERGIAEAEEFEKALERAA